ncbi:MAG: outer membrane protein assembly factor BamB, partial [Gammaproteobacteria bacterium]
SANAGKGVGADTYLKLSPGYTNGSVFSADKTGRIVAMNAKTGAQQWQLNTKLPITSGLAAHNNILIVGANDGQVWALNTQNGQTIWRGRVQNQVLATPTILSEAVLIKTIDGQVCSLDIKTGKPNWCHDHGAPTMILRGSSSPQYADGLVIAGFADGKLIALNAHTGKLVWERTIAVPKTTSIVDQLVDIDVDPRISHNIIYVATYQGNIAAVALRTGQIIWEHPISSYSGLVLGDRLLFVSDAQSTVFAFNRTDGDVIWQQKALANRFITGPVLLNDTIVVGDKLGYLHFLAQNDGHMVARVHVEKKHGMITDPLVAGSSVVVNTVEGKVTAYTLSN